MSVGTRVSKDLPDFPLLPRDDIGSAAPPATPTSPSPAPSPAGSVAAPASPTASGSIPLAERLRPTHIDEVVGQDHLLGPGKPLRVAFATGQPHSMILWGPPGVGKTTLARLTAKAFNADFIALSAVFSGVREIREAVAQAQASRQRGLATLLFVDEVHRFNKAQQDAFLPYVEQGLITLIGATTENPSFEVNPALLSRAVVHVLQPLDSGALQTLFERARRIACPETAFTPAARDRLLELADGDARRLLNQLEQVLLAARLGAVDPVTADFLATTLARQARRFDKGGDHFHDQISALHKSVRGSNPDAALYWLCRMLDGGADPHYLGRRLLRMATEDIGLADPRALEITVNACTIYDRLGSPEGELALAEAAVFLACAAKSNAIYRAYGAARRFVANDSSRPVPMHLRNAPTRLLDALGHGAGYRYAHDEPEAYAAGERYLPEGMSEPGWYQPTDRGLEAQIRSKLAHLRDLDTAHRAQASSRRTPPESHSQEN